MKTTAKAFRDNPHRAITLLGMSGVGKTTLASRLPQSSWFHYSGDYRIGTRYMDEAILDHIKAEAMKQPYLAELLGKDLIYLRNNITLDNLQALSHFLGKIGNPELGGLSVKEFKRRQDLFYQAEIEAMRDVTVFMEKSMGIYNYPHFINDAGGSICCLTDEQCWNTLSANTVVLYLHASEDLENTLIERAKTNPKPLSYENGFLDNHLQQYLGDNHLSGPEEIVPDEFVSRMFPELIKHRRPRYESLARRFGHTIEAQSIFDTRDEQDIIDLICESIDESP